MIDELLAHKPFLKVCGMTRQTDLDAAKTSGVDAVGFIFHAKSPRFIDPERAAALDSTGMFRVGVFTTQSVEETLAIMATARLDLAQLHGDQSPEFCQAVGPERVVRAFWPARFAAGAELVAETVRFVDSAALFLFDAGSSGGGHGKRLDLEPLRGAAFARPWMLAGGLSPDNISEIWTLVQPSGLDFNSGVETAPGLKDPDRIDQAVKTVRSARAKAFAL